MKSHDRADCEDSSWVHVHRLLGAWLLTLLCHRASLLADRWNVSETADVFARLCRFRVPQCTNKEQRRSSQAMQSASLAVTIDSQTISACSLILRLTVLVIGRQRNGCRIPRWAPFRRRSCSLDNKDKAMPTVARSLPVKNGTV
jgi:hypothetical protein